MPCVSLIVSFVSKADKGCDSKRQILDELITLASPLSNGMVINRGLKTVRVIKLPVDIKGKLGCRV